MEAKEIRKVWLLFEQSGTFKKEFLKMGIPAVDIDIQNNFNQTYYVMDIFAEIEKAYERRTANGERRTANGERRTANGERRTANGERRSLLFIRRNVNKRFNNCFFSMYLFL